MALEKTFTPEFKATFARGYHRISTLVIELAAPDPYIRVVVASWVDKAARDAGATPVTARSFDFPLPLGKGEFSISECYQVLKNLPEFSGAQDV